MADESTYADLEIRILEQRDEGYPVEITLDKQLEYERGYIRSEMPAWLDGESAADYGNDLFNWLFPAGTVLRDAWLDAKGQRPQRRIRLRIDANAPELHTVPWEQLRDPTEDQELAAAAATPFSRYLAGIWRPGSPILQRPIKVLVAIADPNNLDEFKLAPVDADQEWETLEVSLADQEVDLFRLPAPCTLAALGAELKKGYHVLHFVGHGSFGKDGQQARLFMADEDNKVDLVDQDALAGMLSRQLKNADIRRDDKLRLVFLASCETATHSPADGFRGLAPTLVTAGVPAVVAMQDLVPVNTARQFAASFYRRLLAHGQVDLAGNEARSELMTAELTGPAVPVLFTRLRRGQLFGYRGQILGDQSEGFWNALLENIADGWCTPFLGPGVTAGLLPSPAEMAQEMAKNYPFERADNLARVAQFHSTFGDRRLRRDTVRALVAGFKECIRIEAEENDRHSSLSEIVETKDWSEFWQGQMESEMHHQLADLNLKLFVTTNFDNFMCAALKERWPEAEVRRLSLPWRDQVRAGAEREQYSLNPPPSRESPVVLHLFGTDDQEMSMVLTEDDYLDFLVRIAWDYQYLLPTDITEELASTSLLFLGYRQQDLDLKVILRGLLTKINLETYGMMHIAVQIESVPDEATEKEVLDYFKRYFSNSKINVYWGSTQQFVAELHARWEKYRDDNRL